MAVYSNSRIQSYLREGDLALSTYEKGKALEDLICYLFDMIPGITITQRNSLNEFKSEEIDIAFFNERVRRGLNFLPSIILVECKNWAKPVSSSEVNWFASKLENRGRDHGILFASKGITGNPTELKCAHQIISNYLAKKINLVVLTRNEIEQLCKTEDLVHLIKIKLCQLAAGGTIFI